MIKNNVTEDSVMGNSKKVHFPGQERDEKINLFLRRHPLSFFGFGLIGLLIVILPLIVFIVLLSNGFLILDSSALDHELVVLIGSGYLLFCLGLILAAWINYYLDIYIITDRRVIDVSQDGLFARSLSATDLVDVEDVKASVDGFLQTFFNYGDVLVQTAGEARNISFHHAPNPYALARAIMDYHEQAVREDAVEVEEKKEEIREKGQEKGEKEEREKPVFPKTEPKIEPREELKKELVEPRIEPKKEPEIKPREEQKKEEPEIRENKDQKIDRDQLERGGKIDL